MLTDVQIIEFQRLYQKCFGREISRQEAYEQGVKLVRLFELFFSFSKPDFRQINKN
ncbi:MAG: hypothetical protein WCT22_03270 [Patescibacteria group bacterium]|jgi:hypothetical protein